VNQCRGDWTKADASLYELLGISKERADEIAKLVRRAFSESKSPAEWVQRLIDEFGITQEDGELFTCAWFAGRYAGVSEVFRMAQREIVKMEKEKAEKDKAKREGKYPPADGYT
jgi:hypothetical protein